MLNTNIIRLSKFEYNSPIVFVTKKNGDFILCNNYSKLNIYIVKYRFSLPLIDNNLDLLQGIIILHG